MKNETKADFFCYGSTVVACQDDHVIAYSLEESDSHDIDLECDNFSSVAVVFTIRSPRFSAADKATSPVSLVLPNEDDFRFLIFWDVGIVQEVNGIIGQVCETHEISSLSEENRIVRARKWSVGKYLLECSNGLSSATVDVLIWGRQCKAFIQWKSIPAGSIELLRLPSSDIGNIENKKYLEIEPCGIVFLTDDKRGVRWIKIDGTESTRPYEVSLEKSAYLVSLRAHPHQPYTIAATDNLGHLFIIRRIGITSQDFDARYSSRRWHSTQILCLQWNTCIDGLDGDTIYTGGSEGSLVIWNAQSLKFNVMPRFPGSITGLSSSIKDPSRIMIILNDSCLMHLDVARKQPLGRYPFLGFTSEGVKFQCILPVTFLGHACFCLFGGSHNRIQFFDYVHKRALFNMPSNLQPKRYSATGGQLGTQLGHRMSVEIIHQYPVNYIAIFEQQTDYQNTLKKSSLQFLKFDLINERFSSSTTIHNPHAHIDRASHLPLYIRDKLEYPEGEWSVVSLCSHPFLAVFLSGTVTESKVWRRNLEKDDLLNVHEEWYCASAHSEGMCCAKFTSDGSVVGIWHVPDNFVAIYDAKTVINGQPWKILRRIDIHEAPRTSFTGKHIRFLHDDKLLLVNFNAEIFAFSILECSSESLSSITMDVSQKIKILPVFGADIVAASTENECLMYIIRRKKADQHSHEQENHEWHAECICKGYWPEDYDFSRVQNGAIVFNDQESGFMALTTSQDELFESEETGSSKNVEYTKYVTFCIEGSVLHLQHHSGLNIHKKLTHQTGSRGILPLLKESRRSAGELKYSKISRYEKVDIDSQLNVSSFKLPPLNIVLKRFIGM